MNKAGQKGSAFFYCFAIIAVMAKEICHSRGLIKWFGLTLVPLALLFTGCRLNEPKADLTFLNGAEPESIDPAIITGQPEGRIVLSLFEGLTSRNSKGDVVPGVAERWELSTDARKYTFFLRPNAQWSNGDPVTAQDFYYSWKRVLEPVTASSYASQLFFVKNAEEYQGGKMTDFNQVGIKVISPLVLEVELVNPTPFFLDLCAFSTLMPVHRGTIEKHGDEWIKPGKIVSNGPYQLEDWRINDKIRLSINEKYWDKDRVKLKLIDVLPTTQANTAYNLFYAGQADLILDKGLIPAILLEQLKKTPDFHSSPILATYFYRFNVTRKPFDDPRVRKAFAMVIDKPRIVTRITKAGEPPAFSMTPPGTKNYVPPQGLSYNIQEARKLLSDAGFPGGEGMPLVRILYNKTEMNEQIATEIQEMFKKELGVQVELQNQEWKVYLGSLNSLNYDIARSSWVGDYNDPNTFLSIFTSEDGNNRTGWKNKAFDDLIRRAGAAADLAERQRLFQEAEIKLVTEEAVIVPLYHYVGINFYNPTKLGGIEGNLLDEHPLKEIYWKEGESKR
ncbi:MAG: peptide ABC transporter substrate-binding protein [Verrucomicrobiota bacterium]|nr:peptide ABC transporter substrate-binding protein [Verrucomicrobiota bacterium]